MTTPSLPAAPSTATVLPSAFFARPAEVVGPELIGCLLVKQQAGGEPLWGVIVETEAYSQAEPACHGHRRRSPQNDTLFGPAGHFYVYVSYGIHHCVNVVTDRAEWANGVLLRAVALPGEPERVAAGPGLLARRFGLDRRHNALPAGVEAGLWLAPRPARLQDQMDQWQQEGRPVLTATTRIGIREGRELPWRWYLAPSRSVSRRARGDATPSRSQAWRPEDTWPATAERPPEEAGRP
ncbi:MAG: DNA-3-methyladenine glycosylase [Cyanobacteria bacterium K_Offshore_surface_m2_239]|nr:DNA-3-methyladenine glycosylase [Cyanobacteria bacterium K_Offshore_surface_m2_239]